jgi:GNAT superfamily N-acetyltransferase
VRGMNIRVAKLGDIEQLVKMRWDFTLEHDRSGEIQERDYESYREECKDFLINAINGDQWVIWVTEHDGEVVSHIFIELIQKVPRPGRITEPFAYMTNVYTLPKHRNTGIGSELISHVNQWAIDQGYEFIIVWPSSESINFYKRNGYTNCEEPMEFKILN